jgi:hypothetical protein
MPGIPILMFGFFLDESYTNGVQVPNSPWTFGTMLPSRPIYQQHTNKHILKIDLDSHESARTILTARRATTSGFDHRSQPAQVENLEIAASILHSSDNEDQSGLRIIKKSAEVQNSSSKERWS